MLGRDQQASPTQSMIVMTASPCDRIGLSQGEVALQDSIR
jgi:hypothetical protein